jgi:pyruvate formate lyase activating enzyme
MKKALIFNIQRYSIHDGGGIRTIVFFKGCPLRCPWCSNPESQSLEPQIIRKNSLCINCSSSDCYACTKTPEECPTGALEVVGQEMTVNDVINEVKKDIPFYETSEGGVTLSGGEPLLHGDFCFELLKRLKGLGINTAIETTGHVPFETLDMVSDYVDTFLYDLKIMDNKKSLEIINANSNLIKENFIKLSQKGANIIPRIPLIPGYTTDDTNIDSIISLVKSQGITTVHLLPFHQYGSSKYKGINKPYALESVSPYSEEDITEIIQKMKNSHLNVIVGGN